MKYLIWLFFAVLMVTACTTTKEVEEETELSVDDAPMPKPQTRSAVRGSLTGEQLAAQLGLEGEVESEFVEVFDNTTAAMKKVRVDHKGDTQSLIQKMKAIKAQRLEAIERLLTSDQLKQYYILMQGNRGRARAAMYQRQG